MLLSRGDGPYHELQPSGYVIELKDEFKREVIVTESNVIERTDLSEQVRCEMEQTGSAHVTSYARGDA